MRILRVFVLIVLASCVLPQAFCAKPKTRVLFIGNSLTAANELPRIITDLARARKMDMEFDIYAPGGYSLQDHCQDGTVYKKAKQGVWDFVVLQERGIFLAINQDVIDAQVKPYLQDICRAVRETSPNARIVIYAIPVRKDMPADIQKKTDDAYYALAKANGALVAPVGAAWSEVLSRFTNIELYADGVHPNVQGSYLIACVFFTLFFHQSCLGLPRDERIDAATAAAFQAIADKTMAFSY